MIIRNIVTYVIISMAGFTLYGCGSGGDSGSPQTEQPPPAGQPPTPDNPPPAYVGDYSSYFSLNDVSVTSQEEYLSEVASFLHGVSDILYSHQNSRWAVTFADRFLQDGYTANGQPALDITGAIPWGNIPDGDRNYTFKLNAMYMTEPLIFAYRETGDTAYFDAALAIHQDWIAKNLDQGIDNPYKWYDMATGLRTVQLSFLIYELMKKEAQPELIEPLLEALNTHLSHLTNPEELGILNHVMFQMAGIYAICNLIPSFNNCDSALAYADEQFKKSISDQYNAEGVHTEHSPTYHTWGLEKIVALLSTGWFPEDIQAIVDQANKNIIWMYHPNQQMIMVGHSEQIPFDRYQSYHPYVEYVFSDGESGVQPPQNVKVFEDTGYAIFRSPWTERPFTDHSLLFFNAGFHNLSHKTRDDLTFSWSEAGAPVLVDSGKYAYDSSDRRRYIESFRAHNTIEIVGKVAGLKQEHIYGSALEETRFNDEDGIGYIAAEVQRREADFTHARQVVQKQREWVYVNDVVTGTSDENIVQWFHLAPDAELVSENQSNAVFWLPTQQQYLHIVDFTSTKSFSIAKGQETPFLQGWYSTTLFEFEPNYAVGLSTQGAQAEYRTLLMLSDSETLTVNAIEETQDGDTSLCWSANSESGGFVLTGNEVHSCSESGVGSP